MNAPYPGWGQGNPEVPWWYKGNTDIPPTPLPMRDTGPMPNPSAMQMQQFYQNQPGAPAQPPMVNGQPWGLMSMLPSIAGNPLPQPQARQMPQMPMGPVGSDQWRQQQFQQGFAGSGMPDWMIRAAAADPFGGK